MAYYYSDDVKGENKAVKNYLKALELNPNNIDSYNNLGAAYFSTNPAKAMEYYNMALTIDPNHVDTNYNIGKLYQSMNQEADAIAHFRRAARAGQELSRKELKQRGLDW